MARDELLVRQIEYYRRRAAEYDATSLGDVDAGKDRFRRWIERLAPTGDVLEIACGTGLWTEHLAARARTLTALDSAPEMIELARSRVGDAGDFIVADIFEWEAVRRYDSIFFGFWLSHVPQARFEDFWRLLDLCLAPGGRVLFVDEGASRASWEEPDRCLAPPPLPVSERALSRRSADGERSEAVRRRLRDGSVHTIVKVFHEPGTLVRALAELGWSAEVDLTEDGLLVGVVRRCETSADK